MCQDAHKRTRARHAPLLTRAQALATLGLAGQRSLAAEDIAAAARLPSLRHLNLMGAVRSWVQAATEAGSQQHWQQARRPAEARHTCPLTCPSFYTPVPQAGGAAQQRALESAGLEVLLLGAADAAGEDLPDGAWGTAACVGSLRVLDASGHTKLSDAGVRLLGQCQRLQKVGVLEELVVNRCTRVEGCCCKLPAASCSRLVCFAGGRPLKQAGLAAHHPSNHPPLLCS